MSIRKPQTRYLKKTHKFGIELTNTVEQALALNAHNSNTLGADAIYKEMENVRVAFEVLPDGESIPIGHQFVQCHMVLNIKMEDSIQKARLVAGGHITKAPATIKYSNIGSREIVRIALIIVTLNDLEIKSGDILNEYVQAPITEKAWTTLGPEFGKNARKTAVIVRALYVLMSARAAFKNHLA